MFRLKAIAGYVTLAIMLAATCDASGAKGGRGSVPDIAIATEANGSYTLTVSIDGLRNSDGKIDMLVFNQPQGWPDEIPYSIRKFEVPAQEGNMILQVPNLPAGEYAVIVVHDENANRRIDK